MKKEKLFRKILLLIAVVGLMATTAFAEEEYKTAGPLNLFQTGAIDAPYTVDSDFALFNAWENQALYDTILNGLKGGSDRIDIQSFGLPYNNEAYANLTLKEVFESVVNDHPELFYIGNFEYSYSGNMIVAVKPVFIEVADLNAAKTEYAAELQKAVDYANQGTTTLEKVMLAHDYLVDHVAYNWAAATNIGSYSDNVYSAYGALVEKDAVCQGYTMAYKAILHQLGINNVNCPSPQMYHIWNIVELDGEWYHVDVTWDDPTPNLPGGGRYTHFLISDATFTSSSGRSPHHGWDTAFAPSCESQKYERGYLFNESSRLIHCENGKFFTVSGRTLTSYDSLWLTDAQTESVPLSSGSMSGGGWLYPPTAFVWEHGRVYYSIHSFPSDTDFAGKVDLMSCNLSSGLCSVIATFDFSPSASADKVYADGDDSIGLTCNAEGSTLSAVSRTRPEVGPLTTVAISSAPITVASGSCGTNLTWTLTDDGTLTISGTGAMTDYSNGSAMPWSQYSGNIISVEICEGVTSVDAYAFAGFSKLAKVSIPASVTKMGMYTFQNCPNLTTAGPVDGDYSIEFDGTTIPEDAFYYCKSLTYVRIPAEVTSIGDGAFAFTNLSTAGPIGGGYDIEFGWTNEIPASAFKEYQGLTSIVFPATLTVIGDSAFQNCDGLTTIVFPDNMQSIGTSAFHGCDKLASIDFGSGLSTIGESAFQSCSALKTLHIPGNVTTIGNHAFQACSNLELLTLDKGVTSIGCEAFMSCSALTELVLPSTITTIQTSAFFSTGVTNVYFLGSEPTTYGEQFFPANTRIYYIENIWPSNPKISDVVGEDTWHFVVLQEINMIVTKTTVVGGVEAGIIVLNGLNESREGTMFAAAYDEDGMMLGIIGASVTVTIGGDNMLELTISCDASEVHEIRTFFVTSDGYIPLCEAGCC